MTTIADAGIVLMLLAAVTGGAVVFMGLLFGTIAIIKHLTGHEIGGFGLIIIFGGFGRIIIFAAMIGTLGAILWVIGSGGIEVGL